MKKLDRQTAGLPLNRPESVLQFGGGNFLRAFVDWMIDHLNKQELFNGNVIIVKPTERGDYQSLRDQDGLFHVNLNGIQNGELVTENTLVDCVSRVIHPYREWTGFLETATQTELRYIISNTTEAGIAFDPADGHDDTPPKEFPAKLTLWLLHRYRHFSGAPDSGCIFLPCELIENNGEALRDCILQYADHWGLEAGFREWINNHHTFCNTLVDRIVSGYPRDNAAQLQESIGYEDELLVAGEYYHSWVIQGPAQLADEMGFSKTKLGVKFVDDLDTYRTIKVRMLNGAHTALVPVGYLSGMRSVREAIEETNIGNYIRQLLHVEVMPTLDAPDDELEAFAEAVIDRFLNPSIYHKLISIALNATSKFRTRLLPSLLKYTEKYDELPPRIVLAMAAMIVFYRGEWKGETINLQDDPERLAFFRQLWMDHENDPDKLASKVLAQREWWGSDLNELDGLRERLGSYIGLIGRKGMYKTLLQLQ